MKIRPAVLALVVVLVLAAGGGAAAWAVFLRGDNVARLSLTTAAPAESDGPAGAGSPVGSGSTASLPPASASAIDAASIPGSWSIATGSVVGYRVRERLASLSADSDAVGRTNAVTGSATIAGSADSLSVSEASFSVDMTTIASDRQMRDNRLRRDGIQTDSFPTSTFKLTKAIQLPGDALTGAQVAVTLDGDLTLHGVTKSIEIPATAQLNGGVIQVLGSLDFPFSDFAIDAPNIGGFVSVEDHGTLEFLINLAKA
jgi:polyisoprenoid-binding protein YceI